MLEIGNSIVHDLALFLKQNKGSLGPVRDLVDEDDTTSG